MNNQQAELLQLHGLTEETLSSAHPDIKLEWANRHVDASEPEQPVVELNILQKKYLGDRALSEMTDSDRENLEWLGTLNPAIEAPAKSAKPEAPAEVAKPLEDDAPVIVDAQSVLDPELIKDLSPVRRAGLADALQTVRRGSRIGDSISQQTSLQQAKFHLAPYVKRKR